MKISQKLTLSFIMVGVLIALACTVAVIPIENELTELGGFHTPALDAIQSLHAKAMMAVEESFAYIISGEKSEKEDFLAVVKKFDVEAKKFRNIAKLNEPGRKKERELFEAITEGHNALLGKARIMFNEFEIKGFVSHKIFTDYEHVVDSLDSNLKELTEIQKEKVENAHQNAVGIIKQSKKLIYEIGVLAIILTIGLGYFTSRAISKPITKLKNAAVEAGKGDLGAKVEIKSRDEIGELAAAFNQMAKQRKQDEEALVSTARKIGVAETATDVLHNVGNVLNSVSVTTASIRNNVRDSKVSYLTEVVGLLEEHADDLSTFMTTEERGRKLPAFLANLSQELITEQERYLEALETLTKHVEHMADIIQLQQSYSKTTNMIESASVAELVEDAIRINAEALTRHGVEVKREFADLPPVLLNRHKVLQILTNLIGNAKYALSDSGRDDKILTICVTKPQGGHFRIEVHDNGVGISEENLTRIFEHGFTTKKHGYGFGLHSAALTAKEMNGSLTAYSDGHGKGTVFILELPFQTQEIAK